MMEARATQVKKSVKILKCSVSMDRDGPCVMNMRNMYAKRSEKLMKIITSLENPEIPEDFLCLSNTFCNLSWHSHNITKTDPNYKSLYAM